MVRHDDESVQEELSLTAIIEDGSLGQFRRGRDLKEAAALCGRGGCKIGPSFLWREPHLSSINERPVAEATPIPSLCSGP